MLRRELELSSLDAPTLDGDSRRRKVTQESSGQYSPYHQSPLLHDDNDDPPTATPSLHHQQAEDVTQSAEPLIQSSVAAAKKSLKHSYLKKFNDPERPKQVCSEGVLSALYQLALFHLPAVSITLALLSLYIAHVRWGNLNAEQLNFLQFAAKGHEILILVSLTNILMHRICYSLLVDNAGLPLGFLSSPFNLGSPIQYLCSWELWAALSRPRRGERCPQITGITIVTTIILSIAAAPLSAIAIIPRQGWWQVHLHERTGWATMVYMKGGLWETQLDARHAKKHERWASNVPLLDSLKAIKPTIKNSPEAAEHSNTKQIANITYSNYYDSPDRLISLLTMNIPERSYTFTVATCPMSEVASSIGRSFGDSWEKPTDLVTRSERKVLDDQFLKEWNRTPEKAGDMFHNIPTSRWKQPLVALECSQGEGSSAGFSFSFYSDLSDNDFFVNIEQNDAFRKFLENIWKGRAEMPKDKYHFLDLPKTTYFPISAQILFFTGFRERDPGAAASEDVPEDIVEMSLCRIYARWVDADVWIEEGTSGVQTQLDFPLFNIQDHFGKSSQTGKSIRMREDWLAAMGRLTEKDGTPSGRQANSSYQQIIDFCLEDDLENTYLEDCLRVTLAAHMTDILSQTGPALLGYSRDANIGSEGHSKPTPGDVIIHETYFLGGYGYDLQSSRTIPFAFSILLLHVLIVLTHVATVLSSPRRPWHGSSWSSFGQILVLALRSRAPEGLGSVGGGVESSRTWNASASVKVVDDEGRLEMILQFRDRNSGLTQDSENGPDGEGSSTGLSRVEPGVKYH